MMCSSATALHALNKARLKPGESVAIFGFGGLGFSALQLARAFDCGQIYVVEINPAKLATATALGAVPIDATAGVPVQQILNATSGIGVDVTIELVGSAATMQQAVRCLGIRGRAAMVALSRESMSMLPYPELISKEAEVIGSVRAMYMTGDKPSEGLHVGKAIDRAKDRYVRAIARPGYAIGAITVKAGTKAGMGVDGFMVTFMKVKGTMLDPTDIYESEWIGGTGGEVIPKIGGDGTPIVGLCGRSSGFRPVIALGLLRVPLDGK
jgi:hypothetical protein